MLMDRDKKILQFINQFGFCEMPHLNQRFNFKHPRNYQIMNKLKKAGLIIHEQNRLSQYGTYRLTKAGALHTPLPPIKRVPFGIYDHEILLIQLYFKLMALYPNATWISERHLAYQKHQDGIGKRAHVPDGLLVFHEGKTVAIELERSLKGNKRVEKILRDYRKDVSIEEIWYFCSAEVLPTLTKLSEDRHYLKVYPLERFLHAP